MIRKKIIIYLRKSRNDAEYETIDEILSRHEKQLQEFCERKFGHHIDEEFIYREIVSGETIDNRPMMVKLLNEIEQGNVSYVVVIEPQRLSRGSFGDIDRIVNTLRYTNTKVAVPNKTYDLTDKFDRKFFEQELLRGNDYLEYVKEILKRGRIASINNGCYLSNAPYGYDKIKIPKKGYSLVPNKDADNVKYIFDKFNEGLGTFKLAKHLTEIGMISATGKSWTSAMTRNILINEVYIGLVCYGKRGVKKVMQNGKIVKTRPQFNDYLKVEGLHQPIISEEVFYKAQDLLKSRPAKNVRHDKTIKNQFAGLIKCKMCGNNMFRKPQRTPTIYCATIECQCVSSHLDLIEERVINLLKNELKDYQYYVSNYETENNANITIYEKNITKLNIELDKLNNDKLNALVNFNKKVITSEEYTFLKEYTTKEENRLKGQINALNDMIKNNELEQKRKAIPILEKCLNEYYNLNVEDKHKLLTSIIDKIFYEKTKKGRWDKDAMSSFTLELFLKL